MPFPITARAELPALPYPLDALEPFSSAEALRLHHDVYHAAHVTGLNATLDRIESARAVDDWTTINQLNLDLAFHLAGHELHSMLWTNLTPDTNERPCRRLAGALADSFGSCDRLRVEFETAAAAVKGSGWAALAWVPSLDQLTVMQIHHHGLPMGATPILVCDVWEHAYYLQYRQHRSDWLDAFWEHVNWTDVYRRYNRARSAHGYSTVSSQWRAA